MSKLHVEAVVNGEPAEYLCAPDETLLSTLRGTLGLTGTKEGCGTGDCGACSVIVNDRLVASCLVLAAEAQGQLGQVEDELFRLAQILDREGELTQLLSDRTAESARKRGLLANVLYGKVTMFTEALALQAIMHESPAPLSGSEAPAPLARVLWHALEKSPDARYQTSSEVLADLRQIQSTVVHS